MTAAMVVSLLTLMHAVAPAPNLDAHGGWCRSNPKYDHPQAMPREVVCRTAAAALHAAGRQPHWEYRAFAWRGWPCWFEYHDGETLSTVKLSNLSAMMRLTLRESGFYNGAFDDGYVAGTWNESRGLIQRGNGWAFNEHEAKWRWRVLRNPLEYGDDESSDWAYDWRVSMFWLAADARRNSTEMYPESGMTCALPDGRK